MDQAGYELILRRIKQKGSTQSLYKEPGFCPFQEMRDYRVFPSEVSLMLTAANSRSLHRTSSILTPTLTERITIS